MKGVPNKKWPGNDCSTFDAVNDKDSELAANPIAHTTPKRVEDSSLDSPCRFGKTLNHDTS